VVIADDEYLVREGARSVLSTVPGIEVVGMAADPDELMERIEETQPDVVLLDIKMPPTHRAEGIEAARRIRLEHPSIGVVILSQYADPEYALELLHDGAHGRAYLLKERLGRPLQLAEAIREVARGGSTLDPKVVDALLEAQRRRARSRIHGLTDRENEVLTLMASGRTNAAIAARLHLSQRAVEKHSNSIFHKLGLSEELDTNQRVAAVLFFLQKNAD
jgi:DNA-binding NarL/FixJ family response regulator